MTIKEIEHISGIDRANIRFYEREGLLSPARLENGYRDYSEEDLQALLRIRLLRSLHISMEEIKGLQSGNISLRDALDKKLMQLEQEKEEVSWAQEICRQMQMDRVTFQSLNPRSYLEAISYQSHADKTLPYFTIPSDTLPRVARPWSRYFARTLDITLYHTVLFCSICYIFRINMLHTQPIFDIAVLAAAYFVMLFVEPIFLHFFGTTPGKAIFGMHIESADGGRLGFWDGVARTWCILGKGLGYGIPVYNIIRLWKSYHQCAGSGENPLPWEEEQLFSITIMPLKWHCFLLCASAYLGLFGIMFASSFLQLYPPNRGELSVAEFAENYNYYLQYYGWNATGLSGRMDSSGQWVGTGSDSYMYPEVSRRNPSFQYYQKDGHIERITIIGELVDSDHPVLSFKPEMALALSAFAGGSAHIDPDTMEQVQNGMSEILTELPEGDFSFFVNNISVRGCQEMNGYNYFLDTYLVPDNDIASPYYRLECYLLKK